MMICYRKLVVIFAPPPSQQFRFVAHPRLAVDRFAVTVSETLHCSNYLQYAHILHPLVFQSRNCWGWRHAQMDISSVVPLRLTQKVTNVLDNRRREKKAALAQLLSSADPSGKIQTAALNCVWPRLRSWYRRSARPKTINRFSDKCRIKISLGPAAEFVHHNGYAITNEAG